ncbi:unnamed protein product [Anisakis simplex]|uniref:ATP-synt_C domain-containing protein n=1 Tax=Anisakis simplex TaxID=6269 RepID=A0A0M3JSF5_ANISI|nr:unnamed protein product [Anisakis simplex]
MVEAIEMVSAVVIGGGGILGYVMAGSIASLVSGLGFAAAVVINNNILLTCMSFALLPFFFSCCSAERKEVNTGSIVLFCNIITMPETYDELTETLLIQGTATYSEC